MPARTCSFPQCPKTEELKRCSACKAVQYCSVEHQTGDWPKHKILCKQLVERLQQQEVSALFGCMSVECDDIAKKNVQVYLNNKKRDVNGSDINGLTLLMMAAYQNRPKCLKAILDAKADVDAYISRVQCTALYTAAGANNTECMRLLLKANADCDLADIDGTTPLQLVASNGHNESVKLLLKAGANCNKAKSNGVTPLYVAAQNGHVGCVHLLLENKACYDTARDDGHTPIYAAAQNNHRDCLHALILAKADVNKCCSQSNFSPLMIASHRGHIDCVSELIEGKANVNAINKHGNTALDEAISNDRDEVVAVLKGQTQLVFVKKHKKKKKKKHHICDDKMENA